MTPHDPTHRDAQPAAHPADLRLTGFASSRRFALRATVAAAAVLGLIGAAIFAGFEIGHRRLYPYELLVKIDNNLQRAVLQPPGPREGEFDSMLVRLSSEVGRIPIELEQPDGRGGGMTSFGKDVLMLLYDGRIYAASTPHNIRATRIRAPYNNRAAYLALATNPVFADDFVPGYLRYIDLAHFESGAQRGLLASYIEYHPEQACYTNTLARLDIGHAVTSIDEVEAGPGDWTVIYRTSPCLQLNRGNVPLYGYMAGGRLAFQAPSTVYMTSGDFHLDGMHVSGPAIAKDPRAEYGKILGIDIETGQGQVVSSGNRNPQGIVRGEDGHLFAIEHGPKGGDELNLIRNGVHYGWPFESYGTMYTGARLPGSLSFGRHERFEPPIFAWLPSIAPSGMTVARGFHAAWDGDLLISSLRDKSLHRVRLAGTRVAYVERIPMGVRLRAVHQHTDGRLVVLTDEYRLAFLSATELFDLDASIDRFAHASGLSKAKAAQLRDAVQRCGECHSFSVDDHERAPSLARIFGQEIASTAFTNYSDSLPRRNGRWTRDALREFLADPHQFAPGTSMPPRPMGKEAVEVLISYLEALERAY
jgi:aldose sugar dehydrogenase